MPNYIYALHCPIANTVRYIGKTKNPKRRLCRHLQDSRSPANYAQRWMAGILRQGFKPTMEILETLPEEEPWEEYERFYIEHGAYFGWRLTNTTVGGEGGGYIRPEDKEAWIAKVRKGYTPEVRARISASIKVAQNRPEVKKASSERMKKLWEDPDARKNMVDKLIAYRADPAIRKRISDAVKRARSDPSRRSAWLAANTTPEVRANQSASKIAAWQEEGFRKKMLEGYTPERRANQAKLIADPQRKAKIDAARNSPEYKAKRAATIRAKTQAKKDAMPTEEREAKEAAHRAKEAARSKKVYAAKKLAKLAAEANAPYTESP